jgi:aminoglycoside phosphotransferase (APT) family kinase protein
MEFIPLERDAKDPRTPLTAEQILTMCRRAFGLATQPVAVRELSAGTFNSTFRVEFEAQPPVILRVAPPTVPVGWDEVGLMRREYQVQPFLAAIAPLIPKILMIDFTHQVLGRDYMFQTFIEGDRWEEIAGELTPVEGEALWRQFGTILKTIHTTQGPTFGWPSPGRQFSSWSETIIYRLERIIQVMAENQLDLTDLTTVLDLVRANTPLLDEIREPHLLHGDLWSFNILIKRGEGEPAIVGVLDADRAWWGDPMADWTMFIWARGDGAEMDEARSLFWQAYGQPEESGGAAFRARVYEAMHTGAALIWAKEHYPEAIQRGLDDLQEIAEMLPTLV